jgi:hypothetical protein
MMEKSNKSIDGVDDVDISFVTQEMVSDSLLPADAHLFLPSSPQADRGIFGGASTVTEKSNESVGGEDDVSVSFDSQETKVFNSLLPAESYLLHPPPPAAVNSDIPIGVRIYTDVISLGEFPVGQTRSRIEEDMPPRPIELKSSTSNGINEARAGGVVLIHKSMRCLPPDDQRLNVGDGICDQIGFCDQLEGDTTPGKTAIPGIFAIRDISSNTFIGHYEGTKLGWREASQRVTGSPPYYLADLVPGTIWVCAKNYGNALRYINHHCTHANCILKSFFDTDGTLCLGIWTGDKKVEAGDHLYIHYGEITEKKEDDKAAIHSFCQCMGFDVDGAAKCNYHFGY